MSAAQKEQGRKAGIVRKTRDEEEVKSRKGGGMG